MFECRTVYGATHMLLPVRADGRVEQILNKVGEEFRQRVSDVGGQRLVAHDHSVDQASEPSIGVSDWL